MKIIPGEGDVHAAWQEDYHSAMKDIFAKYGGGKAYLRAVRSNLSLDDYLKKLRRRKPTLAGRSAKRRMK